MELTAVSLVISTIIVCYTLRKGITITYHRHETYENQTPVTPAFEHPEIETPDEAESLTQKEIEAKMLSDMAALVNAALFSLKEDN